MQLQPGAVKQFQLSQQPAFECGTLFYEMIAGELPFAAYPSAGLSEATYPVAPIGEEKRCVQGGSSIDEKIGRYKKQQQIGRAQQIDSTTQPTYTTMSRYSKMCLPFLFTRMQEEPTLCARVVLCSSAILTVRLCRPDKRSPYVGRRNPATDSLARH
jgi:hypothetical protein